METERLQKKININIIYIFVRNNFSKTIKLEEYCFTFLQISFIVGLIEEGVSYLLLHSTWCNMLLWLKCIKKMKLPTDKKLEEYFNSLLDNGGLF